MELKDIVCSLEPSMELEKLGVKQDSLFYHCKEKGFGSPFNVIKDRNIASQGYNQHMSIHKIASAFTVSELAKILKEESEKSTKIFEYLCHNLNRDKGLWCMSEPDWWANLLIKILKHKKQIEDLK